MPDQRPCRGPAVGSTDLEILDRSRNELSWVTSLLGKESWATNDLISELRKKVWMFEKKVRLCAAPEE